MTSGEDYQPLFHPDPGLGDFDPDRILRRGDGVPPGGYVYDAAGRIALAVNVALATGRPLLVRGKPGSGKSSLAADVASRLDWRYYEYTITSRTQARDLLWSFDAVRRLSDAADHAVREQLDYVTPGVLWWAFSPESAFAGGNPNPTEFFLDPSPRQGPRAVVLIDEIDKADPDVPNDLLIPLGALRFTVEDVVNGPTITSDVPPLVLITTNEERDLPRAFIRRCVVLSLPDPSRDRMLEIAVAHFGERVTSELLGAVYDKYEQIRSLKQGLVYHEPNLSEYLDAVAAAAALEIDHGSGVQWAELIELTLRKTVPEAMS